MLIELEEWGGGGWGELMLLYWLRAEKIDIRGIMNHLLWLYFKCGVIIKDGGGGFFQILYIMNTFNNNTPPPPFDN